MTTTTRRLWLYAVLLLLPALAVGGLALGLLAREQARLAEREAAAGEARRAAVETRARLIAENIELLVGDVQAALMETLRAAPNDEPRAFLTDWKNTNPLVLDVFRVTARGAVIWGADETASRAWLAQAAPWITPPQPAEALTGFAAKKAEGTADERSLAVAAPAASAAPAGPAAQAVADEAEARGDISSNVSQYQSARQSIQEVAKLRGPTDAFASGLAPMAAPLVADADATARADVSVGEVRARRAEGGSSLERASLAAIASTPSVFVPPRSGWTPWRDADGLHVFGWNELPDRTVIGLALRLDAIKARLGEVFPVTPESGEAYALRDDTGRAWHQVGGEGLPLATAVPLAAGVLPGWTVTGAFATAYAASTPSGFFALGASLIALLVLAILAAGGLLVRQARLSEQEAAAKTSFVANVSHELKTPLTTIRLYAELLAQGRVRDEIKRVAYLETIGHETQRLARLVGNVLDFSRLEQGKKQYERVALDLAAELRRLAEAHGPRLAEAGLALRVDTPERLGLATDRDAVEQIVLNLLDNACKYAADGGEVLLALEKTEAGARITVADRGPGVAAEQRERIFEKFHRVDERLTAEKGGAGLGLSIARQLARGLGGDLVCRAREGGGAEFVLTLNQS